MAIIGAQGFRACLANVATRRWALAASASMTALIAAPAFAQSDPAQPSEAAQAAGQATQTPSESAAPTSDASAAVASPDSADPGEVIVTARQRSETLATTPVSVSAVSPAQLEAANAITIQDVSGSIPNVVIQPVNAGPSAAAISIRGIAFADIEKSFDPAVGVLVDGIFIGTNTGQLLDFFDIASLEVLRGPQGTLFGRNTIGGVVNIRRSRPTGEWGGKAQLVFGNYGLFQAKGVLNVPVIKDILAVKLFEQHSYTDGFVHNVTLDRDEPKTRSDNFGAAILLTPTPGLEALLTLEKQTQRGHTYNSSANTTGDLVCVFAPPEQCNRNLKDDLYTTFTQFDNPTFYSSPAETLEINWDVAEGIKLTSITGWREGDETFYQDFDATSVAFYETIRDQQYRQFSQELRASVKVTDRLDFIAGGYYFNNRYDNHQTTFLGFINFPTGIQSNQFASQKSKSYAGYLDVNWEFLRRVRLSVGGRYTHDHKEFSNRFAGPGGFSVQDEDSWNKFTPKVSLDYRPNDQVMVYASYSRGYRAGGYNGRATTLATSQTSYDPETVDSYEAGLKTQFFNRRLSFNLAGFTTKYDNKQEGIIRKSLTPPFNETVVANAASATIRGIEADLTARPVRGLSLNAAVGFLKSHYSDFLTLNPATLTPIDLSGLSLTFNPKFTGSISGNYTLPTSFGNLIFSSNFRHISRYFTSITPDPTNANPAAPTINALAARTMPLNQLDLSLAAEPNVDDRFKPRVNVYVRNLLDKRGINANTIVPGLFQTAGAREPRTYGIELGFSF